MKQLIFKVLFLILLPLYPAAGLLHAQSVQTDNAKVKLVSENQSK